jgi:PKD repeat protein
VSPANGGGYLLATTRGIIKVDRALEEQWRAGRDPVSADLLPDSYRDVQQAPDGSIYATGRRALSCEGEACSSDLLVTKFDSDGGVLWHYVGWDPTTQPDTGYELTLTPDGGCAVVGTTRSRGHGGSDMWVLKLDPTGFLEWDLTLGQEGYESGYSIVRDPEGAFVVAGRAEVEGESRMWVVRIRSDLAVPVPSFTYAPESPVFRDQEVTFNASASTDPGGGIAAYEWDFGDGTTGSGEIPPPHAYHQIGSHEVVLTVENRDGVRRSVTNVIEVTGLGLQWQRFLGNRWPDIGNSLAAARDGGFVVTGRKSDDLWVLKTDDRGRMDWEQLFDHPDGGNAEGRVVIPAHDTGHIVTGMESHYTPGTGWRTDAWLLKISEAGDLLWPEIKAFGDPTLSEEARCVAATGDGGYIISGDRFPPGSTGNYGWLIKTDGEGVEEWSRHYPTEGASSGNWVTPTSDGGYAFTAGRNARPFLVMKTDSLGELVWTNDTLAYYGRGHWIGQRNPATDGLTVAGVHDKEVALWLLSPEGEEQVEHQWTGTTVRDWGDEGRHAVRTPDGGFLITGTVLLPREDDGPGKTELALIKTDAMGNEHWVEFLPGSPTIAESGVASVALDDGSYVVLGERDVEGSPVWLFKLAANRPPVAHMAANPDPSLLEAPVTFDGSGSSDSDGDVVGWEWAFDSGYETNGVRVAYTFPESGVHEVRLTAVDNDGAEGIETNLITVAGVKGGDAGFTIGTSGVTDCPECFPDLYPRNGAPEGVIWDTALGFHLEATATSSTTRIFEATFLQPVPEGLTLFRLPGWEEVPYTLIDPYTVEVRQHTGWGDQGFTYVLAKAVPVPTIIAAATADPLRLELTFNTMPDFSYRVERTPAVSPAAWNGVSHTTALGGAISQETLSGTGESATIFVERPVADGAFYRIEVTPPIP